MKLLKETLPDFYQEILLAVEKLERNDVAQQLSNLTIDRHTLDESEHAMYLYTGGVRELNDVEKMTIGVKHAECLQLSELSGMVVIDLDNFTRVMGIEVLDRPDVESKLK